jgi:hypothetical protein
MKNSFQNLPYKFQLAVLRIGADKLDEVVFKAGGGAVYKLNPVVTRSA